MRTKLTSRAITIACITSAIFFSCQRETDEIDYTAIEYLIKHTAENYIKNESIKGISVGFVDTGGYRYEEGFGNVESSSFYNMASITKVITGLAVMQLKDKGKIDLDTPIKKYIPDFSLNNPYPGSPEITVRHLVTHTAGLSRDNLGIAQSNCPAKDSHLLDYFKNHFQAFPAGYRHSYSNPGAELLKIIIERSSGQDYSSYIKNNILLPLEMSKSNFKKVIPQDMDAAGAYDMFSDSLFIELPINYIAAGGLKSNVPEMLNLVKLFLSKGKSSNMQLVKPPVIETMFTRQNKNVLLDTDVQSGVFFFLEDLPEPFSGKLVYHGGGAIYNNTMLMMAPGYDIGIVVLSNTAGSYPHAEQLARNVLYNALEIKTGLEYKHPEPLFPEEKEWTSREKQKLEGTYYTSSNMMTIKEKFNSPVAKINGNLHYLKYYDNGFFSYYDGFYLKVKDIENEKILFSYNGHYLIPIGKKDNIPEHLPDNIIESLGEYHLLETCPEGSTEYYETIRIDTINQNLTAHMLPGETIRNIFGITSEIQVILHPLNDTTAVMAGFGRYPGEPVYFYTEMNKIKFSGLTFLNN